MNLVAATFATQPVCNATWAAHALRSDQFKEIRREKIKKELKLDSGLRIS
jgi:hypothetical protein